MGGIFSFVDCAVVALGGALGSLARFLVSGLVAARLGETFPYGTLVVNITGCFVIGFFATFTGTEGRLMVDSRVRTFFMTGICGGYTTFSSFSLQTLNLGREGEWFLAGMNVLASVALCMLGVWLGYLAARAMNPR